MIRTFRFLVGAVCLLSMIGCGGDFSERMRDKPSAFGPLGQLNVIADEGLWDSVSDTFVYYFEAPYPLLPQPEPILDIRHFTPSDLIAKNARKHLRTYLVMATLEDTTSSTYKIIKRDVSSFTEGIDENGYKIKIAKDKWASNQMLVYVYALNQPLLVDALSRNHERIISELRKFEESALSKQVYIGGENQKIPELLKDSFQLSLRLPKTAQLAKVNEEIAWIRMETEKASSNILISKLPYRSKGQLSKEGMISLRDSLTKQYIEGPRPTAYMVVNDEDLPVFYNFKKLQLGSHDAYEIRGVWEMENAFMGGPFVTYMVLGPNLESLYFIDLFVYAPGEEKRDLMRHLEYMASTLRILPGS